MKIIYDHREQRSGLPDALAKSGEFILEKTVLSAGDYILSDRLAIERKSMQDLEQSIMDGRLFAQAEVLQALYPRTILLLEKTNAKTRLPEAARNGALLSLMRMGMPVLIVEDREDAVLKIHQLVKQENKPAQARGALMKPDDPDKQMAFVIQSLPGIGPKTAINILSHFTTLAAVFNADTKDLQKVDGVGKIRAKQLYELFSRKFETLPDEEDLLY